MVLAALNKVIAIASPPPAIEHVLITNWPTQSPTLTDPVSLQALQVAKDTLFATQLMAVATCILALGVVVAVLQFVWQRKGGQVVESGWDGPDFVDTEFMQPDLSRTARG